MESSKGAQNLRHVLLPPKVPFPGVSTSSTEYLPRASVGLKAVQKPREGNARHQRTSSESHVMEEQLIWLDDLLNEPESPVRKPGHRRSSSDSFAFSDMADISDTGYAFRNNNRLRNMISVPLRGLPQELDRRGTSFYPEANSLKQNNKPWASFVAAGTHSKFPFPPKENIARQNSGPSFISQEAKEISHSLLDKNLAEPIPHNPAKVLLEKENSNAKPASPETDTTKCCKQQFAQRSRVRKLQYIAELERNVQTLQAEGSEVSAELRFLNQQSLILSMENKSLKQQLESLAQEKLIKRLEQEVLERQIVRLRALYQQQQKQQQEPPRQKQPPKPASNHRHSSSKDLDSQFSNLYLQTQDSNSAHDIITAHIRS